MRRISTLWKANAIAFISSFCVMVIELIAGRILAPYIGVSLYTWTSIIGVILAGIALGNYAGGKIADRYPSSLVLVTLFFIGGLATVGVLPAARAFGTADWLTGSPVMWSFTLKIFTIFFLPAFILSMVSPLVIKLTLADLGQTGGVVGTIYACSTAGSILGTFMTGFYFISWFGTRSITWLVAIALVLAGVLAWFSWRVPDRWRLSRKNLTVWLILLGVILISVGVFRFPRLWKETYTRESNYFAIQVEDFYDVFESDGGYKVEGKYKILVLDHLIHSFVVPDSPTTLRYEYVNVFAEIVKYITAERPALRVLHLGGGGYSFPRYLEAVYPGSINEVVEIDPAVTQVAHEELGLPLATTVKTYNQDARLFLIKRKTVDKYNLVVGDVFNDKSTPYHLTTLEFNRLIKANMEKDGVYLVNIIDDHEQGRYMSSFIHTLRQTFDHVYVFSVLLGWDLPGPHTFILAATDRYLDLDAYNEFILANTEGGIFGNTIDESTVEQFLAEKTPVLLTDDYAPTDILLAPLSQGRTR